MNSDFSEWTHLFKFSTINKMTKHFYTVSILVLSCLNLSAQTEKGSYFLGASNLFEFRNLNTITKSWSSNDSKSEDIELLFSPIFGHFLVDNLSIGVIPSYYFQKENKGQSHLSIRTISVSAFSRYYVGKKKFKPFAHGGIGYINRHQENQFDFANNGDPYVWKGGSIVYDFGVGLGYFITQNVSLDLFTVYSQHKINMDYDGDPSHSDLLNYSFESKDVKINISLIFYFGGKNQSQDNI